LEGESDLVVDEKAEDPYKVADTQLLIDPSIKAD
jgi:hypothetical protein